MEAQKNVINLKAYEHVLIDHELTDKDVAEMMSISTATLRRKKAGETDFYRNEIRAFKEKAGLTDAEASLIFF